MGPFLSSHEYRLLLANLGAKSLALVGGATTLRSLPLPEGSHTVGSAPGCSVRLPGSSGMVAPCHLRLTVGPLACRLDHVAGGTYVRGRRLRTAVLLPEDAAWLGLAHAGCGLQYRVKAMQSVGQRADTATGGPRVSLTFSGLRQTPRGDGARREALLSSDPSARHADPLDPPTVLLRARSQKRRLAVRRVGRAATK